jgi:hypothetical protein
MAIEMLGKIKSIPIIIGMLNVVSAGKKKVLMNFFSGILSCVIQDIQNNFCAW